MGSVFLFPFFYGGDQEHYQAFYDGVKLLSIKDAFSFYEEALGSSEPGYFLIIYFFAGFLEKNIFLSLINFMFSYLIFYWMVVRKVYFLIIITLLFNFYFLVLLFSAERLKVALFLFLMSFFFSGFFRYFLLCFSIFTHVQLLMVFASAQVKSFLYSIKRLFIGYIAYEFIIIVMAFLLSVVTFVFLWEHIYNKFMIYNEAYGGFDSLFKPFVFMSLAMYCAKSKWLEAFLASLPMVVASVLIGAERVVIFSYFVFMFYSLQNNRGCNVPTIVCALYFSFKGVIFVYNIVNSGDGFLVALK